MPKLGSDYILDVIHAEAVTHIFMVPGGLIDPFLASLGRSRVTPIVAAQEGGAAYMADGFARASGRFGVALGIGGPGLGNMVTAVAAASTDGSPLLVLSGEVATRMEGLGQFQDASSQTLDDVAVLKSVTRYSTSVDGADNLPHLLRHALARMTDVPAGPVHLSLPQDVLSAPIDVEWKSRDPLAQNPRSLSLPMANRALARILRRPARPVATRLAILAGAGVLRGDAAPRLAEIAERWHIPVATTLQAKGALPEGHPLSLGVFGYAGTRHATNALLHQGLELLIVLGSGLNERDSMHWTLGETPGLDLIIVDVEASKIAAHPQVTGVVGDAGAFMEHLIGCGEVIDKALAPARAERESWLSAVKTEPRLYDVEHCESDAVPIHPARIVRELRDTLPEDGFVLIDSGAHRAFAGHYWRVEVPGTYVSATNLGPMGWAIPAAVGVQCAQPERRVAVITGDGCMQMHGLEVQTAARYKLPIVYVVINNGALGNVWLRAHKLGPVPSELTTIPDHDWAGFAGALGAQGSTVGDPAELGPALSAAFASGRTCVIDVKSDKSVATPVGDFVAAAAAWSYHE